MTGYQLAGHLGRVSEKVNTGVFYFCEECALTLKTLAASAPVNHTGKLSPVRRLLDRADVLRARVAKARLPKARAAAISAAITIVIMAPSLRGQRYEPQQQPTDSEVATVNAAIAQLKLSHDRELPSDFTWEIKPDSVVNAQSNYATHHVVFHSGLIRMFGRDSGELAFIIGHELGHIADHRCYSENRGALTQQDCELRADSYGLRFLVESGGSPFDAAAAFGREQLYAGDHPSTSHPMDSARIAHMRAVLLEAARRKQASNVR